MFGTGLVRVRARVHDANLHEAVAHEREPELVGRERALGHADLALAHGEQAPGEQLGHGGRQSALELLQGRVRVPLGVGEPLHHLPHQLPVAVQPDAHRLHTGLVLGERYGYDLQTGLGAGLGPGLGAGLELASGCTSPSDRVKGQRYDAYRLQTGLPLRLRWTSPGKAQGLALGSG